MEHQWEYVAITQHTKVKIKWCAQCGCIKDGDDVVAPYDRDGDGLGVIPCGRTTAMSIPDPGRIKRK